LISSDLVLISEEDFRRLLGTSGDEATDLTLKVENFKEIPAVAGKIAELLPDTRQISRDEILGTYEAAFNWRGGIMTALLSAALLASYLCMG
jgi:hypothetical protein